MKSSFVIMGRPYRCAHRVMRLIDHLFKTRKEAQKKMTEEIEKGEMDPRAWVQKVFYTKIGEPKIMVY